MKPTLLIADSDSELCDLYRRFFTERGYKVESASNGLDCLTKIREQAPAVIVLDLELQWGGSDGVLAWLREERAVPPTSVVLTATAGYPCDFTASMEPPVVNYLPKPFSLTVLLESIRAAATNTERNRSTHWRMVTPCPELFFG